MSGSLRKYQIVLLGPDAPNSRTRVITRLHARVDDIGDKIWNSIEILDETSSNFFDKSSPVFAAWFGSDIAATSDQIAALDALLNEAKTVLPVVQDIAKFAAQTPPQLRQINGLALNNTSLTLDRVINSILEGMQLLRRRRRVFISYARRDSRAAAKQLFGFLAECGFDVFLDTHSVPATSVFQDQLWHSMVDSDLVVLLDTNGIDASHWCRQEYERADALSIGIVRVIWPDRKVDPNTDALLFSLPVPLSANDFDSKSPQPTVDDELTNFALERIAESLEGFRARSIAARQSNLVTSFQREAAQRGLALIIQPNSHIVIRKPGKGHEKTVAVIPTIGVPVSTNFHDAFIEYSGNPPDADEEVVLYDRQGFLPSWVDHLNWLNGSLPVKGVDVTEVPTWLAA